MNVQILQQFQSHPRINQLADEIVLPSPKAILLKGLSGSAFEFVFAEIFNSEKFAGYNHVIIKNEAEASAYCANTLESIINHADIFYFPDSFKTRKNFKQYNASHLMLRTEALSKIATGGNKKILITYPEAVVEKVWLPEKISTKSITIKSGDAIDMGNFLLLLDEYGFSRTDFVYQPGQFAIRGGIFDIYTYGNEKPYRIELFGNNVDSIRIIDPETQLSERKIMYVNIIPNFNYSAKSEKVEAEQKISLFQFFPQNTIYWIEDINYLYERLDDIESTVQLFFTQNNIAAVDRAMHDEDIDPDLIAQTSLDDFEFRLPCAKHLGEKTIVEFNKYGSTTDIEHDAVILFKTKEQPAFNRQFDILINDLKKHEEANFSINIFAENPKQLTRLQSIFDDLDAGISFNPVVANLHEGFIDFEIKTVCYSDHQIFQRYHKYKIKQAYNKNKSLTLRALRELQPGDYVTHIDHGVGVFSGLQKIEANGIVQEAVRLIYKDSDILYVNINSLHKIAKFTGKDGTVPKVNKLGSDVWNKLKEKTKIKVKTVAFDLIKLYAQRKSQQGFAHSPDNYMLAELEASFIYEDTPDQSKSSADVKKDMESEAPMDRLVCGDVGFGKTEIAIRAAFKSCVDGRQAAVLVPTTILAFQHYKTFSDRLKDFSVTVDFINRFKSSAQKNETLKKLAEGKVDIIIGTHGLLGKDVVFKDLGLLVIDEEQKFGVTHKEKIKTLKTSVDCLTLTATPIPRTLQFSLMGARDLSIINTPPPNRQPIHTEVMVYNEDVIRDAIYFEAERGGQVFYIFNRVASLPDMAAGLRGLCPDLSIAYAHGQMEGAKLEDILLEFIDRKYDVLLCTNIVESGVDISNVNTIIIHNAHQFGLSDLHQLRGRVGRSNKKAFCYLIAPPMRTLPNDSKKRLQTLEQHSELGSGFQIAMRDLDIRGAGNLLGAEQSGFMADIGIETYQKILNESIKELKRSEFKELFKDEITREDDYVSDCIIDTDLEILIPDTYIASITERLSIYQRLDNCENDEELNAMKEELQDRFGIIPAEVLDLFTTVRIRKLAILLGFERMSLKDNLLKCFFINRPDSPYFESQLFSNILAYLQTGTNKAKLKQTGRLFLLIVEPANGMDEIYEFLKAIWAQVKG